MKGGGEDGGGGGGVKGTWRRVVQSGGIIAYY